MSSAPAHSRRIRTPAPHRTHARAHAPVCASANAGTGAASEQSGEKKENTLVLTRHQLLRDLRHKPAARYELRCATSEIQLDLSSDFDDSDSSGGVGVDGEDENPSAAVEAQSPEVGVSLVVQPVRSHFRVRGLVTCTPVQTCARCLVRYPQSVRGSFEVWLSASGADRVAGLTDEQYSELEAVEDFSAPNARVDLAPHIRDAILLAVPTQPLCSKQCEGIQPSPGTSGSVAYGENAKNVQPSGGAQKGIFDSVESDKLQQLIEKLSS